MIGRQLFERPAEILQIERAVLFRVMCKRFRQVAVAVLHLAPTLAHLTVKLVAQDREKPGLHVGTDLEMILLGPGLHDRVLHEISARSCRPISDIAKARRLGSAASISRLNSWFSDDIRRLLLALQSRLLFRSFQLFQ